MLKFLADENFNNNIIRGLFLKNSQLDIICIQNTELLGAHDPEVLEWAAQEDRILLTHDVQTITKYAYERIKARKKMPGILEVSLSVSIARAIDDILLLALCSEENEWEWQVIYLPL